MAVSRRTIRFLPSVFQTDANRKFLSSTLDQLVSEPNFRRLNGYVGRKFSPAYGPEDTYVEENSAQRQNYQLEIGLTGRSSDGTVTSSVAYTDLVNRINLMGGITTDPSRLFTNEYYSYAPPISIDKLVNYKNYYWLPVGPEAVKVSSRRIIANTAYHFQDQYSAITTNLTGSESNPTLVLKRGTTYTFTNTMYSGNLYIQSEPGATGIKQFSQSSSRNVAGVTNNGSSTITFAVPAEGAQDAFLRYPLLDQVEYAVLETFASLDNAVWQFGDGMTSDLSGDQFYPDNTDIIFLNTSTNAADWTTRTGAVIPTDQRRAVWRMNVVRYSGQPARIQLEYVRSVPAETRVLVNRGRNSGREYVRSGTNFQEFTGITAESTTLFYQHSGRDYYGRIELIDPELAVPVNVTNIIGAASYTTPDGIKFSNGMKVEFDSSVTPSQYQNRTYIVEGVGTAIRLIDYALLNVPEALTSVAEVAFESRQFDVGNFDESLAGSATPDYMVMSRTSQDLNAWARINRWFHQDVVTESLRVNGLGIDLSQYQRAQRPIIEFKENLQLFNSGRVFAGFVDHFYGSDFRYTQSGQPRRLDQALDIVNSARFRDLARLGISLKYRQLVVFADDATIKNNVYQVNRLDQVSSVVFDLTVTGTISITAGTDRVTGQGTDFVNQLEVGTDLYLSDRSYIGRVRQILGINELLLEDTVNISFLNRTNCRANYARVVLSLNRTCINWDSLVTTDGYNRGRTFYLNDADLWQAAQHKTGVNQDPLFDIVTNTGQSLSTAYSESEFAGSKIFSYARGTGAVDNTLGFAVRYSGSSNFTADIVFDNNYDQDTFRYRPVNRLENKVSASVNIGYIRKNTTASAYDLLTNFSRVSDASSQYQHVTAQYDAITNYFEIGQYPASPVSGIAALKVYVNNRFLRLQNTVTPEYTIETYNQRIAIRIDHNLLTAGDRIDIFFRSSRASSVAYYEPPVNLENNPYNKSFPQISFGQMRNHLQRIGENARLVQGDVFASSNIRDIDTAPIPGTLLQHSASMLPAMAFLMDPAVNFMAGVDSAARDYERFKYRFLEATTNYLSQSAGQVPGIVDSILDSFAQVKNADFAWYYSDMVAFGNDYYDTTIRVTNTAQRIFNLNNNFAIEPNNQSLLIYVNNRILTRDIDYTINTNATVTFASTVTLTEGDIVSLREYTNTDGSFVPETPSKLGMYPRFIPAKIFQESANANLYYIQGHDGSLMPAFNDLRDDLLLELEKRIYNNIKVNYSENLFGLRRLFPGKFRTTDYTRAEFNSVMSIEFLKWAGENQLDYTPNTGFVAGDAWTWNYNQTRDLDGERVPGSWQAVYRYYYDTDRPDTHPWEMLGYSIKPGWWDANYSWTDAVKRELLISAVTNGRRLDPANSQYTTSVSATYARPGFATMVPVDTAGTLLNPQQVVIGEFNSELVSRNFAVGDLGPVELAWTRTSSYAFAVQKTMALLKPAEYFGLHCDTAKYERRTIGTLSQYLINGTNSRPDFNNFAINGEIIGDTISRAASYLNWIHGYLTSLGLDPVRRIRELIGNSTINLTYKFAGFTDKRYINVLADQVSLTSTSESVIIPEESYQIFLNKSEPVDSIVYSGVIIEKTSRGWSVTGYDQRLPYFIIIPSQSNGSSSQLSVLGTTVTIYDRYFPQKIRVPYGFEFTSIQQVTDFLVGYQRYLVAQGIVFDNYDANLGTIRNWQLSVREFITWARQGWATGNILVLSPIYNELTVFTENTAVDVIDNSVGGSQIVGTNFDVIRNNDFTVIRDNKRTTIKTISGATIALIRLNLIQYEHVLVLDNRTIFADVMLNPELGERQYRVRLLGGVTDSWDGDLTPPGFVYTSGEIDEWEPNTDYKKGSIVSYKFRNYSALENLVGAETFNFNKWTELDSIFRQGLAPNFSQNAAKFSEIYDVDSLPIDESLAAYSNSLIGFKPRDFLDNLGMTPISQIKFYQGYIKTKGTQNAITAFARGNFDRIDSDIEVYEEWAARIGSYGAIDSSPEYSWLIENNKYDNNPLLYQFVPTNAASDSVLFTALDQTDLLTRPSEYSPSVFRQRQQQVTTDRTWRVEMFGDSVMCGKRIEPKTYEINLARRHGYSLDIQTRNQYSVQVSSVFTAESLTEVANEQSFRIDFSSVFANEPLYITIEPVDAAAVPLATSRHVDSYLSTSQVLPASQLSVAYSTKTPYEAVYLSFEPISNNEMPQTNQLTGSLFYPDTVRSGQDTFIDIRSVRESENISWSIEELAFAERPSTTTAGLGDSDFVQVCLNDPVTGRVDEPPDYLLYQALESDLRMAITTRSVEDSTTGMLLAGTDGVNGVWPDNIEADIVIINHGLNDAKNGVSLDTYRDNLRELRRRLPADRIVIWQTPAPLDRTNTNTRFELGTNDLLPYARAMRQVALENGDRVVDITQMTDYADYISVDGIHPTQAGYKKIVNDLLAPTVRKAIRDRESSDLNYFEDDLKTAGYVRSDEVDSEIFDIARWQEFDSTLLTKLATGYKIWTAKDFHNDWQVYRAYQNAAVIKGARADLNNKAVITCDRVTGLRVTDMVAIRNVDAAINGFYQVFAVNGLEFTVIKTGLASDYLVDNRNGQLFDFTALRYRTLEAAESASTIHGWIGYNPYQNQATDYDNLYIDYTDRPGSWQVYRPKIVNTVYENLFFSNVIASNTYSIVGINCTIANSVVGNVAYSEQINFCIFSANTSEELYYTIEPATIYDTVATPIIDGTRITYANSTVSISSDLYDYELVRSADARVDIDSINNMYLFDSEQRRILSRLDLYDPAKGRILGTARAAIDIISEDDPASYRNTDPLTAYIYSEETYWADERVGTYWWNTNNARFVDYEHGSLADRAHNWGRLFPGSQVEVYEWIASDVLPSVHVTQAREGTPLWPNDEYYTDRVSVDPETNTFVSRYYFWVKSRTTKTAANKDHSTVDIEQMIAMPVQQGIPFVCPLRTDAVALFNVGSYTQTNSTVFYLATTELNSPKIIHSDFQLIQQGNGRGRFPAIIEQKLIDSICGIDKDGNLVPDPVLAADARIGLGMRPRQTLIRDLSAARTNIIRWINERLALYPVTLRIEDRFRKYSPTFFARDAEPAAGTYDVAVATNNDIYSPVQTKARLRILVQADATFGGMWAVYDRTGTVNAVATAQSVTIELVRKQSFDVARLWQYQDWYHSDFDPKTIPTYTIDQFRDIYRLILVDGDVIRVKGSKDAALQYGSIVTRNQEIPQRWELYQYKLVNGRADLELVGLEAQTIQLRTDLYQPDGFDVLDYDVAVYDDSVQQELRYIFQGLKEEIFVNDLAELYQHMLFAMVEYVLTEQRYIDWFFKTSFISVREVRKGFNQSANLIRDRQRVIESYIEEVKPYRTKIREFVNNYTQVDQFASRVTDFDLPAYYDSSLAIFRSPSGEYPSIDLQRLQRPEYQDWLDNYKYSIGELVIANPGYGYRTSNSLEAIVPSIEILRTDLNAGQEANAVVRVDNVNYGINRVTVTDAGSNYTETPVVKVIGVGGNRPRDRRRHQFTVTAQGYSYFQVGARNRLGFGLFGRDGRAALDKIYARSLINIDDWQLGSGGTATFSQSGLTGENERVRATDPWQQSSMVWETRPSGNGGDDGGWTTASVTIDPTKTYRSVVWMRRTTADSAGTFAHGLSTNGTGNVLRLSDGVSEPDPFWNTRSLANYNEDEWYLHVGFIFPAGHTGTSTHQNSGIYTRQGGRVYSNSGNINDAKFPANATTVQQRCRHSGSNAFTRGQFAFPRFELVDGSEPQIADLLEYGPYQDLLYTQRRRGYHMHRIRRADGVVASSQWYDIHGQSVAGYTGLTSSDLARDLNATSSDYVVVVHTYDEPQRNRLTNGLDRALLRCGASAEIFGRSDADSATFKFRSAYILVGIPGSGPGRGIEHYAGSQDNTPDAYAAITFRIERGYLSAIASDPKHYVFAYPFALPAEPAAGEFYTYGERSYVYTGTKWQANKRIAASLDGDREPFTARLSPRLTNTTVRKVKTTVRFDRVQYTTKVQDWQPNVTYTQGTYLSYLGQAYQVANVTYRANTFVTSGLRTVASTEFDNANDRIMGFYVPETALSIPKDLERLVPGVSDLYTSYTGSTAVTQDTILVGDTFASNTGITAGNIRVSGGKFVDRLFAYAPEELLPGIVYDSLSIRVLDAGSAAGTTTTTTTAAPLGLTLGMVGKTESTVQVPYNEVGLSSTDTFTVGLLGEGDATPRAVTVSVLEKPAGGAVTITPSAFNLLPGQQQAVTITATNNMFQGKTWYDLSPYQNHFQLLDNSPTWSLVQRGMFTFNAGSDVNDRATSITTMSGINTTAGGYNTVAMWMRWTGDNNGFPVEFKTGYRLWMPGGALGFNNGGGDCYGISASSMAMFKNSWILVVAVFHNTIGGSTYVGYNKLYINGTQRTLSQVAGAATSGTAGIGITFANSTTPTATPDVYEFGGDITEVYAYNKELTQDEVLGMYFQTRDRYPGAATTTTTSTTSTTSTSTTTSTTLPPPPPVPPGIPATNAAWGGNGVGGTYNYRGGYSASGGHLGNAGGGSASPLGGSGGAWSNLTGTDGSYGTGGSGGGYTTAGSAGTGGISGYSSSAINATGVGNGGGGVETDSTNGGTAPINGGDGTGGLVRITIAAGSYTFTNADLVTYNATRLVNGGQGIEWDNSANASKKNSTNVYQYALIGNFTVPAGVTAITIGVIAGGGGGATGPCINAGGGGGGAALLVNYAVSSGAQYIVKAGAGGQGGRQSTQRNAAGGPPYGVDDAPWRGGWSSFCQSSGTEIVYATGGNTRPDNCAGVTNGDSASANTMD